MQFVQAADVAALQEIAVITHQQVIEAGQLPGGARNRDVLGGDEVVTAIGNQIPMQFEREKCLTQCP